MKKNHQHSRCYRAAAREEPRWGRLGQPGIGNAALPGTADNGKCFSPFFLKEKRMENHPEHSKHRDALLEKKIYRQMLWFAIPVLKIVVQIFSVSPVRSA